MAKVGRLVMDPKAGAYCNITLASGERVMINHDQGGFKGGVLTIVALKWMGFASGDTIFTCDLDSPGGKAFLSRLTARAFRGSISATPVAAIVELVKDCASIADVRARCTSLLSRGHRGPDVF